MKKKNILLVEDNMDDRLLTEMALKKNGIDVEVIFARDGAEAIEILNLNGDEMRFLPDMILLDIKLPKTSGTEVLKMIRENKFVKTVPVIVLTSSDNDKDLYDSYRYGANSFIRKPVDFTEFTDVVKNISNYWLHLNQFCT